MRYAVVGRFVSVRIFVWAGYFVYGIEYSCVAQMEPELLGLFSGRTDPGGGSFILFGCTRSAPLALLPRSICATQTTDPSKR